MSWHCPGGTVVNTKSALTERVGALYITLPGVSSSVHLITERRLQSTGASYVCVKGWVVWNNRKIPIGFVKQALTSPSVDFHRYNNH